MTEKDDKRLHDARNSRNRVLATSTSVERHSTRQDELVGRSEIGAVSEASEVVGAMHSLAG
jgi:hypothetical protein